MLEKRKLSPVNFDSLVVEAVQITTENILEVAEWLKYWTGLLGQVKQGPRGLYLEFYTDQGTKMAYPSSWLIKYPMSRYDFQVCIPEMLNLLFNEVKLKPFVEETTYNEDTLLKVYATLTKYGMTNERAIDAVAAMQNDGILFRERKES